MSASPPPASNHSSQLSDVPSNPATSDSEEEGPQDDEDVLPVFQPHQVTPEPANPPANLPPVPVITPRPDIKPLRPPNAVEHEGAVYFFGKFWTRTGTNHSFASVKVKVSS